MLRLISRYWNDSVARLVLLALVTVLSLVLGFATFSARLAVQIVTHGGYFVILVTFGWLLLLALQRVNWNESFKQLRQGGWRVVLFIIAISCFLHLQEQHGFKIVNDEIVQLSTSQRMHETRQANMVGRGYQLGTEFVLFQGDLDKRPLFFPFLVATLHDLTGYRPENPFVLNTLLTPILFGLLYSVARRIAGPPGGYAAVLLFSTLPLVTQTATSGGFEILNLVMILASICAGMRYATSPNDRNLSVFCLTGVLLAQVRYESILFTLPVALTMAYVRWREKAIRLPWAVLLAPLLLVIYPLQLNVMELYPGLWQLDDRFSEHGVFSIHYFYENVGRAMSYFLSLDRTHPNSPLLAITGIVGLGFFLMYIYRHHREVWRNRPLDMAFIMFVVALCFQAMLMLCYFWGAYDDVVTVRLSLPTQLLFVLAFIYILPHLSSSGRRWVVVGGASVFCLFGWTLPTLAQRAYALENYSAETSNWIREYLRTAKPRNPLVIDPQLIMLWTAHGIPAVPFTSLAQRADEYNYHFRRGTFDEYLVVQKLGLADPKTGRLAPVVDHDLGTAAEIEVVREIRFSPTYAIRIGRIVRLDEERFLEWAKQRKAVANQAVSSSEPPLSIKMIENEFTNEWLRNLP